MKKIRILAITTATYIIAITPDSYDGLKGLWMIGLFLYFVLRIMKRKIDAYSSYVPPEVSDEN